jgi:type II secretory pathway pseudopilin PulG
MSGRMKMKLTPRGDAGLTLVELLTSMMLMAVVGGVVLTAVINAHQVFRSDSDEAQGLADVRTVVERMGRDIRDARGLDAGATDRQLTLWIDTNSNSRRETSEVVTWKIVDVSGASCTTVGHCNVVRSVPGQTDVIEARTLISDFAFTYDLPAPNTRLVEVRMKYDAVRGRYGTGNREVVFRDRLRNVA